MNNEQNTDTDIARLIDHTLLKPDATAGQIRQLCQEALTYDFASVCVNPTWVPLAADLLHDASPAVCTVIGFPLGANLPEVKAFETKDCIEKGAQEVDMVINVGALKSGDLTLVEQDIKGVVQAAGGVTVKVIIETALLTEEEKITACKLSQSAGADFVKTSTGFSGGGATVADIELMRRVVGPDMGVKASGGIHTAADARALIAAGATRLGVSAGVKIMQEIQGGQVAAADNAAADAY